MIIHVLLVVLLLLVLVLLVCSVHYATFTQDVIVTLRGANDDPDPLDPQADIILFD